MKGILVLVDSIFSDVNEFEIGASEQDFCMNVFVTDECTLEQQLKNRKSFDYCMTFSKKCREESGDINEEELKEIEYISEHFDNLLDSVEYIKLSFDELDNMEFIKKNPIVLSKKIVLNEMLDITDYNKLIELIDKYKDIVDKVYIYLSGNANYVSLLDCYKTMNEIKKRADEIKKLGLSPMETIMYVYDQVRNRVYTFESENETRFKSRDLSEVLFGDKIVCAGYANIFSVILNYIGIDNNVVHLTEKRNPKSGHARNIIYVKDDKYDIDGVYYFDPTWNSKRKNENNEYLYRYTFFAKTRKFMDDDESFDFEDIGFPIYSIDMDKKIEKIIKDGKYEELISYSKSLNYMSCLVTKSMLVNPIQLHPMSTVFGKFDSEEFLRKFEFVFSKFNKELSAETMLKVLNNVRKIEYFQNPEWYPYSLEDMYKTYKKSNWKFEDKHLDPRTKMLQILFGDEIDINPFDNFKNYGHESGLFQDVEQVRLTKVLQKILEKKRS